MVEYERHRNTFHMDSKYDSYNYKNDFSDERYKSYRSLRNGDELKYSYKLSQSNYRDNIYSYRFKSRSRSRSRQRSRSRSRQRSRSRSRERFSKYKYSRRERSKERYKSKLFYDDEVISRSSIRYSKSNYDYEHSSRSPPRRSDRYLKDYKKTKSTLDTLEIVNSNNVYDKELLGREFSIKRGSFRSDKENQWEHGKPKLNDNCNDSKSYNKKSLLGNGPEQLRIYLSECEEPENHRIMCEETVALMNSQNKLKGSDKPDEYISNKSPNLILIDANLENHGNIQIIDYNHEKDISYLTTIPLNPQDTLLEETPSLILSTNELDSISDDSESALIINEHIDSQIKSLADLLTKPAENEIKWKLIPLFAPIRKRISEQDIDINSCSEYDPRIAHIVQNLL